MKSVYILAALACFSLIMPAFAQDAGALLRDRELADEPRLPELLPEEASPSLDARNVPSLDPGQNLLVQSVQFGGAADRLTEEQRADLRSAVEGRTIGFSEILALTDSANAMLRQNGFLLAQAALPPQDVTEGSLTIDIRDGFLEDVLLEKDAEVRISDRAIVRVIDRKIDRRNFKSTDLESALLRVNDLAGVNARSRLTPGEAIGASRLIVDVTQDPIFAGVLYADNFGSPSTGQTQGHAQLAISDVAGIGELTRLGLSYSEGQEYVSAGVSVPLTPSGISVAADYGYLRYENIDPVGLAAGLEGTAHFGSLSLDYQAVRSRNRNLRFSAALDGKALTDSSAAGKLADKRVVAGSLTASGDVSDSILGGGINQFSVSWLAGDLDLSRVPSSEFADSIGLKSQGKFQRVNANVLRLQRLGNQFSVLAKGTGQWASQNLDSSESFSLGGPYGVRGWPVGEGRGDMGVAGSVELQYDTLLTNEMGSLRVSAFFDAGHVWLNKKPEGIPPFNVCACNDYSLTSAGSATSWRFRNLSVTAGVSFGLGSNPGRSALGRKNTDGSSDRHQAWLSTSIGF